MVRRERRMSAACRRASVCMVGLVLVSTVQLLAGPQPVWGAQAAVVGRGDKAPTGGRNLLRERVLRSLQEETPAPVTSDTETPSPSADEAGDDDAGTPSPQGEDATTPETPAPVADDGAPEDETPAPVADDGAPEDETPSPAEGETSPGTPSPAEGETSPGTPSPAEGETSPETPSPAEGETSPETPSPAEGETSPGTPSPGEEPAPDGTPAPGDGGDGTAAPAETGGATPAPVVPEPAGSPAPFAPSVCSNGVTGVSSGNVCCKEECGQCGGVGCGAIAGTEGASDCCPGTITEESGGLFCDGEDVDAAPCVMSGFTPSPVNPATVGTAAPVSPSTCSNGIDGYQDGEVCCVLSCGQCGGAGCGSIPGTGGSSNCCPSEILAAGTICGEAPCIIEGFTPAPAVVGGGTPAPFDDNSTCSNNIAGVQDGAACCAANCGQCGGGGCGAVPGTSGASACCSSTVLLEGELCSVAGGSPCIIDDYTPAPVVPDFGSAAPVVPSTCSNGLAGYQNNDVCCLESCGVCGGAGCGEIPGTGGSSFCCPGTIREAGEMCGNGVEAPCIIGGFTPSPVNPAQEGTAAPVVATFCSNGLPGFQNGAACCRQSCGQCGGVGCGTIPGTGGSENCCATDVLEANQICGGTIEAPCVIENYTPAPMGVPGQAQPFAASTCTNGLAGVQDAGICCAENCGQCGGVGCGAIPGTGGSDSCCSSTIAINGTDCLDTMAAPCIISDFVPTPSPTVLVEAAPVLPSTCTNGLSGYQDGQVCCLLDCGQCGGVGCGSVNGTAGSSDCCPSTILLSNRTCGGNVVAPCIIPLTPAPTIAPAATPFPTRTPFVAGNANDFVNTTSAAEPRLPRHPAGGGVIVPLATAAAAALLGAFAVGATAAAAGRY